MAIIKNPISVYNMTNISDVVQKYFDKSLTNVTADDLQGATNIKDSAFTDFDDLVEITIPDTVTKLGQYIFLGCNNLTTIIMLGTQPPTIYDSTFGYIGSNFNIYVPDSSVNTYKTANWWSGYSSRIYGMSDYYHSLYPDFTWSGTTITGYVGSNLNIEIPRIATAIGNSAFEYFGGENTFGNIFIPDSITSIGTNCFAYTHINTITFDENCSIMAIPAGFVLRNFGLTSITLPKTITSIGDEAFSDGALTSIILPINTPPTLGSNVFRYTSSDLKIYVPSNRVNIYKAASGWSDYASQIEAIPNV